MTADTIFKTEEKPEIEKIAMMIRRANDKQKDTMSLVIQSVNLGIAIGKGEVKCEQLNELQQ